MVATSKHSPEVNRTNRQRLRNRAELGDLRLPGGVVEIRRALGITQAGLAEITGLTVRAVAEMETGKSNPTVATLMKIGKLFGWEIGFVPRQGLNRQPDVAALIAKLDDAVE